MIESQDFNQISGVDARREWKRVDTVAVAPHITVFLCDSRPENRT
jgi:hypothetical protein